MKGLLSYAVCSYVRVSVAQRNVLKLLTPFSSESSALTLRWKFFICPKEPFISTCCVYITMQLPKIKVFFFSHNELTEKAQAIPKMLSKIKAVFILELFLQSKKGYH